MGNTLSSYNLKPEHRRSIKCYIAVCYHLKEALLDVVHDQQYGGIPRDPTALYQFFNQPNNIQKINKLRKKILKQDQYDLLLPNDQKTCSKKWDITLICLVIINFTSVPKPTKGWKATPDPADSAIGGVVLIGRQLRNGFNHATLDTYSEENDFNVFFTEIENVLVGLNYKKIAEFDGLKNESIDENDIDLFMRSVAVKKVKEEIIGAVLDWLKKNNEKVVISTVHDWLKKSNFIVTYSFFFKEYQSPFYDICAITLRNVSIFLRYVFARM